MEIAIGILFLMTWLMLAVIAFGLAEKIKELKTSNERERLIHFLTESMKDKDSITIEQQVDTYLMNN